MYKTIRVDNELYEIIAKIAKDEDRSINAQVLYMLKQYIKLIYNQNKE